MHIKEEQRSFIIILDFYIFLYNDNYSSFDDIFINCYNIKFDDLLKELDQFLLQYR